MLYVEETKVLTKTEQKQGLAKLQTAVQFFYKSQT